MPVHSRSGLKLPPGTLVGDLLTWDGRQYVPAQPAVPSATPPGPGSVVNNSTVIYVDGGAVPSSLLVPLAAGCLGRWESDFGTSTVVDGAVVTNWNPADGAFGMSDLGAATGAIYRRQDQSDNIPYLEFRAAALQGLTSALFAAYLGAPLTVYVVARPILQVANSKIACVGRVGVVSGSGGGTMCLEYPATRIPIVRLSGQSLTASQQASGSGQGGLWTTFAIRLGTKGGRQFLNFWQGGSAGWGLDWTALGGTTMNTTFVGLGWDFATGGDFSNVDIRHFSVYEADHRDDQVRYMGTYLSRYGQPPLL